MSLYALYKLREMIGFPPRTAKKHRLYGDMYRAKEGRERDELFKTYGVRYTELNRLPYFDAIRMTVVDPMHNILLGTFPP